MTVDADAGNFDGSGGLAGIDFGDVAGTVSDMLQEGVSLYRQDRLAGEKVFRQAMLVDETALAPYFCLYKILTYQGRLDEALTIAQAGLALAAEQAGLEPDPAHWRAGSLSESFSGPVRFALFTLKAMAFIHLKRGDGAAAREILARLDALGCLEGVGGGVIAELADAST
jgi:hypothetical protein